MNSSKNKKKHHGGLWTSLIAVCMTGIAPIIMGFMLFIICAGTVISVYFFGPKEEEQEVIDLSLCPCGDCSKGYEYIGDTTTGGAAGGSGSDVTVAAHGKKITDTLLNPYDLPLYDGLTMDASKLGCDSWTVEIANNSDPVVQQAATKNVHSYMYHLQTIGGSPYADASNQTQIRIVDGRLCIAVGRGIYRKPGTEENGDNSDVMLGRYVDVVQKDGTVLACVIGDVKDTHHTIDTADMVHSDGSIVEMQTNDKRYEDYKLAKAFFQASGHPGSGSFSFVPGLNSVIDKIIVYDVKHYTKEQGYKPWFTESLNKLSSAGSSVAGNIIHNAIDSAQSVTNNIQTGNTSSLTGGSTIPIGQAGKNKTDVKTNVKLNYSSENVDVANWDGKIPKEYVVDSCDPITIKQHLLPDKNSSPHSGNITAFIVHYWGRQSPQTKEVSGDNLYSGWVPAGVKTSATFSMGTAGDIWQYVPLNRAPNASNTNNGTLAIEVADRLENGQYTEAEYKALVHLTAWICYTYNLDTDFNWQANPRTHNKYWDYSPLRRHYDTLKSGWFRGKACPAYWVPGDGGSETPQYETAGGNLRWIAFKEDVTNFLIEYKDHQNFAPTNVNELAGYQESLSLVDKSKTPNWANGSVMYGQSDGTGNISRNLADYRGKGCGCKIPCPNCTCHDADAEQIKNNSQIGGTTSGEGSETGSGNNGTMSDSDGVAITGGVHLGTGGEGIYYTIDNNILTFKGDSWASTTFLKNARAVTQYYVAAGCGYVYGGSANVPPLGTVRIDCSGYISQVLKYCGYSNPYITSESDLTSQLGFQAVAFADMQPGDIVRYKGHVAIFCGWPNGQPTNRNYLAYNWGGQSDKTAYGAYAEPRLYGSDKRFIAAYRPVPPS